MCYFIICCSLYSTSPHTSSSGLLGTIYPIAYLVNCDHFSSFHRAYLAAVDVGVEPRCFDEIMQYIK